MAEIKDRIFVSIGVSKPRGGLDEIPGAIFAAERMAAWARAQGYETLLLHDEIEPEITVDLLREKITKVIQDITNQTELKRLIIFFAGHGGAKAVGDQIWLLTNWCLDWREAIRLTPLQRMLAYFGPKQVTLIGDACQDVSPFFIDVYGSQVLNLEDKMKEDPQDYELDRFLAVGEGKQAFMIPAKDSKKAFCLFTETLLDALEGDTEGDCFETINGNKFVTSDSLANYLKENVPREAGKYKLIMKPDCDIRFRKDRVYSGPFIEMKSTSSPLDVPQAEEESYEIELLGATRGKPPLHTRTNRKKAQQAHERSVSKVALIIPELTETPTIPLGSELNLVRKDRHDAFLDKVRSAPVRDHFETNCGICVSGTDVADITAPFGVVTRTIEQPNWFRIELNTTYDTNNLAWSDALVTLADGRTVSVCALFGFVAVLHILDETSICLFHHPVGADPYESNLVIELLAQLHADLLTKEQIIDSACMLRHGKHRFITIGCIAAQFYDAIRDVDSLRSMAAFYAMNNQPVPLDIILYGGGTISENDGRLFADIPAVAERNARTPQEQSQRFTYMSTPEFKNHPIAGRIPWMRQAWGAIETARYDKSATTWQQQALAANEYLTSGAFTVVSPEGREAILELASNVVQMLA